MSKTSKNKKKANHAKEQIAAHGHDSAFVDEVATSPVSEQEETRATHARSSEITLKPIDWFAAHARAQFKREVIGQKRPESKSFVDFMWPASVEYYSPIFSAYLNEFTSLEHMCRHTVILARDGLVPLLWFFRVNPRPITDFSAKILVHEQFAPFVPQEWRKHFGSYKIESFVKPQQGKKRKFFIAGIVMDTFCSLKHLEAFSEKLVQSVGAQDLRDAEKQSFLMGRFDGFGNEDKHDFHSNFYYKLCSAIGSNVKAMNWSRFESAESYESFELIDLNEKLLWADSYLVHTVLSKGAGLLDLTTSTQASLEGEVVPISPYHGIRVRERLVGDHLVKPGSTSPEAQYYTKLFEETMLSQANRRFPWPDWYHDFARLSRTQVES